MSKTIPHRKFHEKSALNAPKDLCGKCPNFAVVLHHDHLADYAKRELREALFHKCPEADFSTAWQTYGIELVKNWRFEPVYLCQKCNEGDGWAKVQGWRGLSKPIYPESFSMVVEELARARCPTDRIAIIRKIWQDAEVDHQERRATIDTAIREIVRNYCLASAYLCSVSASHCTQLNAIKPSKFDQG